MPSDASRNNTAYLYGGRLRRTSVEYIIGLRRIEFGSWRGVVLLFVLYLCIVGTCEMCVMGACLRQKCDIVQALWAPDFSRRPFLRNQVPIMRVLYRGSLQIEYPSLYGGKSIIAIICGYRSLNFGECLRMSWSVNGNKILHVSYLSTRIELMTNIIRLEAWCCSLVRWIYYTYSPCSSAVAVGYEWAAVKQSYPPRSLPTTIPQGLVYIDGRKDRRATV